MATSADRFSEEHHGQDTGAKTAGQEILDGPSRIGDTPTGQQDSWRNGEQLQLEELHAHPTPRAARERVAPIITKHLHELIEYAMPAFQQVEDMLAAMTGNGLLRYYLLIVVAAYMGFRLGQWCEHRRLSGMMPEVLI